MIKRIAFCTAFLASSAYAMDVSINGFLTGGMAAHNTGKISMGALRSSVSSKPEYYVNEDFEPKYEGNIGSRAYFEHDTLVGMQIDSYLNDKWSATVQLMSEGQKDFKTEASWAFVKYEVKDNLSLRIGKLRLPAFLMSEYLQVGHAFNWVRTPREVYGQVPGGLNNYIGADLMYRKNFNNYDLSLTVFYGGAGPSITVAGQQIKLLTRNAMGVNATFGDEELTLRAGYAQGMFSFGSLPSSVLLLQAASRTEATPALGLGKIGNGPSEAGLWDWTDKKGKFMGVGMIWDNDLVYAAGEATRRLLDGWLTGSYGWYVSLGAKFGKLLPTLTFARQRSTDPHKQLDMTGHGNRVEAFEIAVNVAENGTQAANPGAYALAQSSAANTKAVYNYIQDRLYDQYNAPQDTYTFALRYDLAAEVILKGSFEYIKPRKNGQGRYPGFFSNADMKGESVKMGSFAINVLF